MAMPSRLLGSQPASPSRQLAEKGRRKQPFLAMRRPFDRHGQPGMTSTIEESDDEVLDGDARSWGADRGGVASLGPVPLGAAMGHCPGGLLGVRHCLGLLPA